VAPAVTAPPQLTGARRRLVEELRHKGIRSEAVLDAIAKTPRHVFVPTGVAHRAYEDSALPIGSGQTISQPYVHARSLELAAITPTDTVLEVGTGSGYQSALLGALAGTVYSIETVAPLADRAREALRLAGTTNVHVIVGDGSAGWAANAPYDAIIVSAAAPSVPAPLVSQLAEGGRLVVPVGDREAQRLILATRRGTRIVQSDGEPVRFVPLLGEHGWSA